MHDSPHDSGKGEPNVSVVIPTHNGSQFIHATLESVLEQTYTDFEVIVSDDDSGDQTMEIVESFNDSRLRIALDRSHVGAEDNWNRALSEARGTYVKVLAQDDLLHPRNLEVQVAALDANESLSFAAVQRDIIGAGGVVLLRGRGLSGLCGQFDLIDGTRRVVRSGANQFGEGAAILFRRAAGEAVGEFDGSLPYAIDIDYWLRLLAWGPGFGVCDTHAAFRVSSQSWSNALVREQGRQFVALIDRVAGDPNRRISRCDVAIGKGRANANALLRKAFYMRHRSQL